MSLKRSRRVRSAGEGVEPDERWSEEAKEERVPSSGSEGFLPTKTNPPYVSVAPKKMAKQMFAHRQGTTESPFILFTHRGERLNVDIQRSFAVGPRFLRMRSNRRDSGEGVTGASPL
jgi:hypothetical protein